MKDLDQPIGIIEQSQAVSVQQAQQQAEILNAAKRQAERQEKYEAWSDPDAMQYRKLLHDKKAFESLQALKASGEFADNHSDPLPDESELPKEMRGQQPSTIRAWMRGNPKFTKKIDEHRKVQADKDVRRILLKEKYPDLFGLDDMTERKKLEGESTDYYRVKTGKTLVITKLEGDLKYIDRILSSPVPAKRPWYSRIFSK